MSKPVINISEVELLSPPPAMAPQGDAYTRYEARMDRISPLIGAQKLGYNITAVPPGKRAFPPHSHLANEEMFFVLEGTGEVQIGDTAYPIRPGDIVALPPGGRERAHVVTNTGAAELKYLAVSTRIYPEVCEYPVSRKFGVIAELPSGGDGKPAAFRFVGRLEQGVDYWEGE
jgi:uncharacterized cupin superfamily protein